MLWRYLTIGDHAPRGEPWVPDLRVDTEAQNRNGIVEP